VQILIVFGVGMLFTTMGAAIPAWIAAKMPPIEAMRGEK
jgi:ABC-type antimicrobial peptide transport system permease subunit